MKNNFKIGKNFFGYDKYSPILLFTEEFKNLETKVRKDVSEYLLGKDMTIFEKIRDYSIIEIDSIIHNNTKTIFQAELDIEKNAKEFNHKANAFVSDKLIERCHIICNQVIDSLLKNNVETKNFNNILDVGAGSGLVAKLIKDKLLIRYGLLTDVVDYRYDNVVNDVTIDFRTFRYPFNIIDTSQLFDFCIITNVLHHSDNPLNIFSAAYNSIKYGGYIVIIESCIGIESETIDTFSHSLWGQKVFQNGKISKQMSEYLLMNNSEKMLYGSFFDWLYNRIFVDENINVPLNFGTPHDWNNFFQKFPAIKVLDTYMLGFDQPSALEFHTLHILKKTAY
jgi:SAM-dependent methyltransferase